ncbi:MAG TPA: hypothetical protein VK427_16445, partial [Kofleriaceae bacterium]|nr:hypothetical protein [Kofleriaceae bacterium]
SHYHFGFAPPANVQVTYAPDFAVSPLGADSKVRFITNMKYPGDATLRAQVAALGLHPITLTGAIQLYDARDGAELHAALQPP